jgi:hypothetical protein
MGYKFIFHVFPEELLLVAMWLKLPIEGQGTKKEFYFAHRILAAYFSLLYF